MTPDRKAILIFLAISIVALGVAFGYRYQKERADIAGIEAGQGWANRAVWDSALGQQPQEHASDPESTYEPECIHDYIERGSLLFRDGSEFCLTWERETSVVDNDNMYDPMRVTQVFSLIGLDGEKREIARRIEGYQYTKSQEHVAIPGLPKASSWYPIGISKDDKFVYFTRAQGLPIDGFSTGKRLDLWSLDVKTGKLMQVYRTGDIWDWSRSPEIVDVNIASKRLIVRDYLNGNKVSIITFDGNKIVALPELPFDLKDPEGMMDIETYTFSSDGGQIVVTARREVPYGSGKDVEYGPVVFDIEAGKYLK